MKVEVDEERCIVLHGMSNGKAFEDAGHGMDKRLVLLHLRTRPEI